MILGHTHIRSTIEVSVIAGKSHNLMSEARSEILDALFGAVCHHEFAKLLPC